MTIRKTMEVRKGDPKSWGTKKIHKSMQFVVEAPANSEVSLLLYKKGSDILEREIVFKEEFRQGRKYAVIVDNLDSAQYEYNYKINGMIVQDPCAYEIVGREKFGSIISDPNQVRCAFLSEQSYDWQQDTAPAIPYHSLVLYKLHVRGFSKQAKIPAKKKGTFAGIIEMIPYFKDLGINAIELMPAYEFAEISDDKTEDSVMIQARKESERVNYWGYGVGYYFAPKSSYSSSGNVQKEFRDMVRALHAAGIECIMEMFFPANTAPLLALHALWFWKMNYHVDGFHLIGDGVPYQLISSDSLLSGTKRMFAGVDENSQPEEMLGEYNIGFLQDMRRYLKSDEGMLPSVEFHIRRNTGRFGTVNYLAAQDGFTLFDAVSYNYRHNESNGEENHDGTDYNYTWNCGVEGPSRKLAIRRLREQQLRNAFLMILLSQGTPLIYAGDEFGNSQDGNNNAWCQDNATGWTDWKAMTKNPGLLEFVKRAIAFRMEHPILHMPKELKGVDYKAFGFPDVSFHGERAWYLGTENTSRLLGVMYNGAYADKADGTQDDFLYVGYNFHWENRTLALPNLPNGMEWVKLVDTSDGDQNNWFKKTEETFVKAISVLPRSIVVLTAVASKKKNSKNVKNTKSTKNTKQK